MAQIQVYGTQWCPDCVRVKQIFKRHNIAYVWHDIGEDDRPAPMSKR